MGRLLAGLVIGPRYFAPEGRAGVDSVVRSGASVGYKQALPPEADASPGRKRGAAAHRNPEQPGEAMRAN